MKTLSIKQYRKQYNKTNPDIAKMFGLSDGHTGHLQSKGYTITTYFEDGIRFNILAPSKNIHKEVIK